MFLPESRVRIVFDELGSVINANFFDQSTAVSEGSDLKVDEVVLVGPLRILWSIWWRKKDSRFQCTDTPLKTLT